MDTVSLAADLDARGWGIIPALLSAAQTSDIAGLFDAKAGFRSHIDMARHGFGRGEYKYFAYPLPPLVAGMRSRLYPLLIPIANAWAARLGGPTFPDTHAAFVDRCHAAGQCRPTPLLLRYGPGDYNCLHQDLYGEHLFPLQVAILLDSPGQDFTGGDFVLTEQRPRTQSRADVVPLHRGNAGVFAVNHRPVAGSRGDYRVTMRHGVAALRTGRRHTLGIIFHDVA